jgi:hypothetical protein
MFLLGELTSSACCRLSWRFGSSLGRGQEELTVIEPIPEGVEAVLNEILCGSEIEPGIDCRERKRETEGLVGKVHGRDMSGRDSSRRTLVYYTLESNDGEQTTRHSSGRNCQENEDTEDGACALAAFSFEENIMGLSGHDLVGRRKCKMNEGRTRNSWLIPNYLPLLKSDGKWEAFNRGSRPEIMKLKLRPRQQLNLRQLRYVCNLFLP